MLPGAQSRASLTALTALGVLALLALAVLSACTGLEPDVVEPPEHPLFLTYQACNSCKEPLHDYRHVPPYDSPECTRCHILTSWSRVSYLHATPEFNDLFHAAVGCPFCHTVQEPIPSPDCATCHEPFHMAIKPCTACHNASTWRILNAPPKGHVSLKRGHAKLTCFSCHTGPQPLERPKQCVDCHGEKHGGFLDCARCHDPSRGWKPKTGFNHDDFFRLSGRHKTVPCAQCHPNNRFRGLGTACASCHGVKHGGLVACADCHTTAGFKPSTFRHSSRFVLRGAHAKLACSKCHPSNRYADVIGSPSACTNCHGTRHGGLRRCDKCHTTTAFRPSTFRHSTVFKLTGRHAQIPCSKCHPSNRYADVIGSPSACTNCHGVKHGNQTDCAKCHTTTGFIPAKSISHPVPPPLGGEHAARSCTLCHAGLVFNAPAKPCSDCHTAPHIAPSDCLRCHTPTVWPISHPAIGYHTSLPIVYACQYCHTTQEYPDHTCTWCHGSL